MKRVFLLNLCMIAVAGLSAQTYKPGIKLKKGQQFEIVTVVKGSLQQMGMETPIESEMNSTVTVLKQASTGYNVASSNKHFVFKTSMMGQDLSYDSDKKDNSAPGEIEGLFKNMVGKIDSFVVDNDGYTKPVSPEKPAKKEEKGGMMGLMLGGLVTSGGNSPIFNVLPSFKELKIGESVTDTIENNTDGKEKTVNTYTLTEIKEGKVKFMINGKANIEKEMQVEQMGMNMNIKFNSTNTSKGELIIDESTGLLVSKTVTTETDGTAAVMGQEVPITGTSTTTVTAKSL